MKAAMDIIRVTRERRFAGVSLKTRIGINTGDVIAGNVGSGERFNYTVHGDAVNLAARLEQLNKQHGTSILIGEGTVERLTLPEVLTPIRNTTIRGKEKSLSVYAVSEIDNLQ